MTTGIDAAVVLGLAGKAAQVFAEEGTHLSFPLAPRGMRAARLRALVADPMSPDGQGALAEFSQLVNEIPEGALWQPDGDRLWEVYGDVLAGADLAEASLTAAEQAEYQRAHDVLFATDRGGVLVESPTVRAHDQCRDAYLAAAQEYNNRKGEAATAGDPGIAEQWTVDEPALLERVAAAERDWAVDGHRTAVEDARRMLRELGSRSPAVVWAGYRKLFDPELPEIFFRTAPDGSVYLPTGYLPSDVVDTAWPTITVTRQQLAGLATAAPAELRDRLASGGGSSGAVGVESVSFEYSAVQVTRPWLVPEAFGTRAWRFRDPTRVLSDGGQPPRGDCTAYVDGVVLARNITVRHRAGGPPDLGFLPSGRPSRTTPIARPYPREAMLARVAARRKARSAGAAAAVGVVAARAVTVRDHRTGGGTAASTVRDHRSRQPTSPAGDGARRTRTAPVRVPWVPGRRRPVPRPQRPATPAPAVVTSDPDEVYMIAFCCRALPRSPDPDPALAW